MSHDTCHLLIHQLNQEIRDSRKKTQDPFNSHEQGHQFLKEIAYKTWLETPLVNYLLHYL